MGVKIFLEPFYLGNSDGAQRKDALSRRLSIYGPHI